MVQTILLLALLFLSFVSTLFLVLQPWILKHQSSPQHLATAGHLLFLLTGLIIGLFAAPLLNLTLTMEITTTVSIVVTVLLISLLALNELAALFTRHWPVIQRTVNLVIVPLAILFVFTATLKLTAIIGGRDLFSTTVVPMQPEVLGVPAPQTTLPMVQVAPQPTATPALLQPRRRQLLPTATWVLVPTQTPTVTATPTAPRQLLPTLIPDG